MKNKFILFCLLAAITGCDSATTKPPEYGTRKIATDKYEATVTAPPHMELPELRALLKVHVKEVGLCDSKLPIIRGLKEETDDHKIGPSYRKLIADVRCMTVEQLQ